jgi:hypothetical protein
MHFENEPGGLEGLILGTISGLIGIALLVLPSVWLVTRFGELNLGWPILLFPIVVLCLSAARACFMPVVAVDLQDCPRVAHVERMNLVTGRKRRRSFAIPDTARVILDCSDGAYLLRLRRTPFSSVFLTGPRSRDEGAVLAANVGRLLGVEVDIRG